MIIKEQWTAICVDGKPEYYKFTRMIGVDDDNGDLDFRFDLEQAGYDILAMFPTKDLKRGKL